MNAITIVMPVYNDLMVARAIQSVTEQSFQDWRLDLLNNGCTDQGTLQVLKRQEGKRGIYVHHFPFNRQSECGTLFALEHVETPLIAFLFSDDQWHPEFLKTMIERLERDDVDAVFCNTILVDEDGVPWKKAPKTHFSGDITEMTPAQHLNKMFYVENPLHPCALVMKTSLYKRLGGANPCMHRLGDMNLFARMLAESKVSFVKEKMASITLHSICGARKNCSFGNDTLMLEIMLERQELLRNFLTEPFLEMADDIFEFPKGKYDRAGQIWFMGLEAIKNPTPDYVFFGYRCIFQALAMDYAGINKWCLETYHTSPGEYVKKLQNRKAA